MGALHHCPPVQLSCVLWCCRSSMTSLLKSRYEGCVLFRCLFGGGGPAGSKVAGKATHTPSKACKTQLPLPSRMPQIVWRENRLLRAQPPLCLPRLCVQYLIGMMFGIYTARGHKELSQVQQHHTAVHAPCTRAVAHHGMLGSSNDHCLAVIVQECAEAHACTTCSSCGTPRVQT